MSASERDDKNLSKLIPALDDGSELWITVHPSYLLRLDGEARDTQERLFAADAPALRLLRNTGMSLFDRGGLLKHWVMRVAVLGRGGL